MPGKVLSQLLRRHASMRFTLPLGLPSWPGCGAGTAPAGWTATAPTGPGCRRWPSTAGSGCTRCRTDLRLSYDRSDGYLVLLRTERDRAWAEPGLQLLRDAGVKFALVDAAQARTLEPA
jgi:D-amino-acid dehydrogenase